MKLLGILFFMFNIMPVFIDAKSKADIEWENGKISPEFANMVNSCKKQDEWLKNVMSQLDEIDRKFYKRFPDLKNERCSLKDFYFPEH